MLGKISHTDDAGLNNDFWHATRFRRTRQSFFEELECLICSCPTKFRQGIAMRKSLLPPSFRKRKTSGRSNSRISRRIRPERQEKNFLSSFSKAFIFSLSISPAEKTSGPAYLNSTHTPRWSLAWSEGESQGCHGRLGGRGAFSDVLFRKRCRRNGRCHRLRSKWSRSHHENPWASNGSGGIPFWPAPG